MHHKWDLMRERRASQAKVLTFLIAVAIIGFCIWALRPLFMPILTGAFLAYLCRPLMDRLRYSWLPETLRITLIISLILGLLFAFTQLVRSSIPSERDELELMVRIQYKLNDRYSKVMGINEATGKGNFLHSLVSTEVEPVLGEVNRMLKLNSSKREAFLRYYGGVEGFKPIEERFYQYLLANEKNQKKEERNEIEKNLRDPASTGEVDSEPKENQSGFVSILYSAVSIWLVMPFVFFFLLIDNGRIEKYFLRFVPNHYFELALTTIGEADGAIGRYLRGTLLECSLVGLTLSLGLFLIGVPPQVSLLIGIIAGLTNAIPFLGPLIGLVVGLFYALIAEEVRPILPFVNLDNLFIAVISVVAVAQLLDNAVFQPIVLGSAVNLHPLVVILGVVGGGSAFGFVGMLLAIPTIVVCKEVLSTIFRELRAYRLI